MRGAYINPLVRKEYCMCMSERSCLFPTTRGVVVVSGDGVHAAWGCLLFSLRVVARLCYTTNRENKGTTFWCTAWLAMIRKTQRKKRKDSLYICRGGVLSLSLSLSLSLWHVEWAIMPRLSIAGLFRPSTQWFKNLCCWLVVWDCTDCWWTVASMLLLLLLCDHARWIDTTQKLPYWIQHQESSNKIKFNIWS